MGAANTVRFIAGAALFSPLLAGEDLLRKMGVDVPQKGIFYNEEGKSMLEIFNEMAPEKLAPYELRQTEQLVSEVNEALEAYNKDVDLIKAKRTQIMQMVAAAQAKTRMHQV